MRDIIHLLTPQVADAALAFVNLLPAGTGIALTCAGLALVAFALSNARALIAPPAAEAMPGGFEPRALHDTAECDLHYDLERVVMEIYPGARLLSQVAMAEFLRPGNEADRRSIEHERVDFLLVDARFQPFCALEYQPLREAGVAADARAARARAETPKRRALRLGGVPLVEVPWHYDRDFLREQLDVLPAAHLPPPPRPAAALGRPMPMPMHA